MNIILFGFKGCGKTYFGKRLAEKMKRRFIDADTLISELYTQNTNQIKTIREIYREAGEMKFRDWEREAIHTLEHAKDSVIALGGGSAIDPKNVAFLKSIGELVYLQASFQSLRKRIFKTDIPAFINENDPAAALFALYRERTEIFESIQAHRINTDTLDEFAVIAALQNILHPLDS